MAKTARYVLPATIDPADSVCFRVQVPNDPQHIAAFKGQILDLTWSRLWQKDATNGADLTSRVWQRVFNNLEACPVPVQFRQNDICTLQVSFNGGATWDTIFDASTCATNGAKDVIQDLLDDGTLAPPGQQPPSNPPVASECFTYNIQIFANSAWHLPFLVSDGDTVIVSLQDGGWSDGAGWYCPNGSTYILAGCFGAGTLDGGDPLPTSPHMSLIASYGGLFVPAIEHDTPHVIVITIPSGHTDEEFTLQANDPSFGDNQGSITAKVVACRLADSIYYDPFLAGYGPKTFDPSHDSVSTALAGAWSAVGGRGDNAGCWQGSTAADNTNQVGVLIDLGTEHTIIACDYWYKQQAAQTTSVYLIGYDNAGVNVAGWGVSANVAGLTTYQQISAPSTGAGIRYILMAAQVYLVNMTYNFDDLHVVYV